MKILLSTLMFLAFTTVNWAQTQTRILTQQELNDLADISPYSTGIQAFDLVNKQMKGSPMHFEDWKTAKLVFEKGKHTGPKVSVNMDVMTSTIWFQGGNGMLGNLPNKLLYSLIVYHTPSDSTEVLILPLGAVEQNNLKEIGYFKVLFDGKGKHTLLKRVSKTFIEADYNKPYGRGVQYDEYLDNYNYYLSDINNSYTKIKLRAKTFKKLLGDEVKTIINKHDLEVEKEQDAVRMLKYLNGEE